MSLSHELRYFHPDGTAGEISGWSSINLRYGLNGIGELVVSLPLGDQRSDYYQRWGICEVWRSVNGTPRLEGDRLWRLQYYDDYYDADRRHMAELRFLDDNNFLDSRIIAYYNGTSGGTATMAADNYMKTIVSENLSSGASASRANPKITVAALTTQAAEISRIVGYNNLHKTLKDASRATNAATPVFFDCVRTSQTTSEFRTYYGQRGTNRGSGSSQPITISMEAGNLLEPHLVYDWREERNYIYAMGRGEASDRETQNYPAAFPADPTTLRELVIDARDVDEGDTAELLQAATIEYEKHVTRPRFTASIQDTREFQYGRDFGYGDVFIAQYRNHSFDVHLRMIEMQVDKNGKETLTLKIQNYD